MGLSVEETGLSVEETGLSVDFPDFEQKMKNGKIEKKQTNRKPCEKEKKQEMLQHPSKEPARIQ